MRHYVRHALNASRQPSPLAGEARWMLRGLSAGGAAEAASDEPPARFKIANWGPEEFRNGKVVTREDGVAEIRRRMAANRVDRVRIDIAHKTAFKAAKEMDPADILGYADLESVPGDGLYLCNATWTPNGRKLWQALPDPSPAFLARKSDHLMVELDSVGLCPNGELELPTLCAADASIPPGTYLQSATLTDTKMNQVLIALLKKAGVKVPEQGDQSDTEYTAALQAAAADYIGGEEPAEKTEEMALSADFNARLKRLEADAAKSAAAADRAGKEEIVRRCSAEGKVLPFTNDQLYGLNGEEPVALSAVRAVYGNLEATVAVSGQPARQGDAVKKNEVKRQLSADEKRINDLMGVTQEEIEKHAAGV